MPYPWRIATLARTYQPLLGTVVDLRLGAKTARRAKQLHRAAVEQITRLQAIFSVFDPDSALCQLRRGQLANPPQELIEVLGLAQHWNLASEGRFNPSVGALQQKWSEASAAGTEPKADELLDIAEANQSLPFAVEGDDLQVLGDCQWLNLNAIAKGWIVDQAVAGALADGAAWVTLSAGGDVLHSGPETLNIGVENPHRPYDNEPSLFTVSLNAGALATSGGARRGVAVDDHWVSHLLDPRTGQPAEAIASATVLSATAAEADVLATILAVTSADEAISMAHELGEVAAAVVTAEGEIVCTPAWDNLRPSPTRSK